MAFQGVTPGPAPRRTGVQPCSQGWVCPPRSRLRASPSEPVSPLPVCGSDHTTKECHAHGRGFSEPQDWVCRDEPPAPARHLEQTSSFWTCPSANMGKCFLEPVPHMSLSLSCPRTGQLLAHGAWTRATPRKTTLSRSGAAATGLPSAPRGQVDRVAITPAPQTSSALRGRPRW